MKLKTVALVLLTFVAACSSPQVQAPPTEVVPPSRPPPQPTLESTSTETPGFRDDFDGELLEGWTWVREDPSGWSLSAATGYLQIDVGPGHIHDETISNLLMRPAPTGDFQIETSLTFTPQADFQFAGLVIFESSTDLMQAGRAFCEGGFNCVGDGIYLDYYENGTFMLPNFAQAYTETDTLQLRLIKIGTQYTFQSSSDGTNWILRGGHASDLQPLQIGLFAGQNTTSAIPALFDYFEISSVK